MNARLSHDELGAIGTLAEPAIEQIREYQGQFREVMALIDEIASQLRLQLEPAYPSDGTASQSETSPFSPLRWSLSVLRRFF